MKEHLWLVMPTFLRPNVLLNAETKDLRKISSISCDPGQLLSHHRVSLEDIFNTPHMTHEWEQIQKKFEKFEVPDGTGGVNPGDRRALYYVIRQRKPRTVLEIGTHIGASTIHIAAALYASTAHKGTNSIRLDSVDIENVNCSDSKPWLNYGTKYSPLEMIRQLGFESFVTFHKRNSLEYLTHCQQKYDFIFLDGNHEAKTVYQEIPVALKLLTENGMVLLHDYFPGMRPLWSNGSIIPGPFLATERLRYEGASLKVLPLGGLPWPTKLNSNVTSLALLLENSFV